MRKREMEGGGERDRQTERERERERERIVTSLLILQLPMDHQTSPLYHQRDYGKLTSAGLL